jgi:deferrochelatase/peroxidase EfeB
MRRNVWVGSSDGPPWMAGGTYQVYRRVRLHIGVWDASPLDEQQDTFGRFKASGAPYGGVDEFDPVVSKLLPVNSHVRLSNPRTGQASEDERILRRGYNFHDGYDPAAGDFDAGLAFIAYQRDPRRQFITIQQRLAANDALNEYLVHTASGIFAIPPGVRRGDFIGSQLLAH